MGILDAPPFDLRRYKPVQIPTDLGWDQTTYPISMTLLEGFDRSFAISTLTSESAFDAVSTARSAPSATFYVNGANGVGNDTTGTGAVGAPFRSIWRGIQAANTAGVPSKIIVLNTTQYDRQFNPWNNNGTGIVPTVDIALIASGGRILSGTWDFSGTLTKDATYTNCCAYTVATVARVMDMANLNRFGNYTEFVKVSTAAVCNVTPNSWSLVSGTLYINRADQAVVTSLNTRIIRSGNAYTLRITTPINLYIGGETSYDGFDFEGGPNAVLEVNIASGSQPATRKVIAANNCSFKYGGGDTQTSAKSVYIESLRGLAIFTNCRADASQTDGFNFHNVNGAIGMHAITINCTGLDNGRLTQASCNGWTSHEDIIGIDIAGYYDGNHGGTIRSINSSKSLIVGSTAKDDFGDYTLGGQSLRPSAIRTDDFAKYWCDRVRAIMPSSTYAYTAYGNSQILQRNCWPSQGSTGVVQSGVIGSY